MRAIETSAFLTFAIIKYTQLQLFQRLVDNLYCWAYLNDYVITSNDMISIECIMLRRKHTSFFNIP